MVFSGFSHLSRNFLANFREGARKRLNLAENWGGLGIIRDDLGSCSKVLKTVWGQPHKGSNPFLSAKIAAKNRSSREEFSLRLFQQKEEKEDG